MDLTVTLLFRIKEHTYGTEMEVSAESTGMDKMNKIWRKMGCFVQVIQIVNRVLRNIMLMSSSVKCSAESAFLLPHL
jgi:hypothetical protein